MKILSVLEKDMKFNKDLYSLIEVMKNIAVSQYRSLENKIQAYDKFFSALQSFFEFIDVTKISHPFLIPRTKSQLVVAVTSDTGLLGGLNMQIVNTALQYLNEIPGKLVVIGDRGKIYASEAGVPFDAFKGVNEEMRYDMSVKIGDYIVTRFLKESIGYLKVVYPRAISFTLQKIETVSFLPCGSVPGANAGAREHMANLIFESDPADILGYLVYLWIRQKLFEIFGMSRLAEFAARFSHLEGSSQRLKDMDGKLRLQYFRLKHELVDRNMRELFSARLLYAAKRS
jgi:ATP synthase F1 gamma subunit